MEVIAGMEEGATKYGPWNWRSEKVNETIYVDAAIRHLMQWVSGEDIDPDSGLPHISKAVAGLLILRDAQVHGCSIDDRGPIQDLNIKGISEKIAAVHAKYANPNEAQAEAIEGHRAARAAIRVEVAAEAIGNYEFGPSDVGREVIMDRLIRGTITRFCEDDNLPVWVSYKDSDGEDTSVCLDPFGRLPEIDHYMDLPHGVTHLYPHPVTEATTVSGGGSRLLTQDDLGKVVDLRDGRQAVIAKYEEGSEWPFVIQYDLNGEEETADNRGYTWFRLSDPFGLGSDVVRVR